MVKNTKRNLLIFFTALMVSVSPTATYAANVEGTLQAGDGYSVAVPQMQNQYDMCNREGIQYSDAELTLAAQTVYHEAYNQGIDGWKAVAEVLYNRVRSGLYPNNITDVVYQKGQFSGAGEIATQPVDSQVLEITRNVLDGNDTEFCNPDVLYFRNPGDNNNSDWGSYPFYVRINNHCFYTQN